MELTDISSIKIAYENCEVYNVDKTYIKEMNFSDLKTKYKLHSFPTRRFKQTAAMELIIRKEGNDKGNLWMEDVQKPFERTLHHQDIVSIYLVFDDGKEVEVEAPWEGDSYEINPNQQTFVNEEGDLVICIKEKHKNI